MSGDPRVTVVVPILDAAPYLGACVESVLRQEYESWELMLVDDGSTDSSVAIARRCAAENPGRRIQCLQHEGNANRGSSTTRNLGIRHGRGELVTFLDADDVWYPHTLKEQVERLDRHPEVGFVYGRGLLWNSWRHGGTGDGSEDIPSELGVPTDRSLPPGRLLELMLPRKAMAPLMGSLMVRREALEGVGGFEDSFTGMHDDQVLVAKLNLTSASYAADRVWLRYRQHPSSMYARARASGSRNEARFVYLTWLRGILAERGLSESTLTKLVDIELAALASSPRHAKLLDRGRATAKRALNAIIPTRLRPLLVARWRAVTRP